MNDNLNFLLSKLKHAFVKFDKVDKMFIANENGFQNQVELFKSKKVIFIHIPKAAGTSIFQMIFDKKTEGHFPLNLIKKRIDKKTWNQSYKFAFVRNPYTRSFSAFQYLKNGGYGKNDLIYKEVIEEFSDFDSFIKRDGLNLALRKNIIHFIPQSKFIKSGELIELDFLGKYENLLDDVSIVCARLNIVNQDLPILNVSSVSNTYSNLEGDISREAQEIIYEFYKEDFILFKYSKNISSIT